MLLRYKLRYTVKLRYESLGSACVALGAAHLATFRLRFGRRRHGSRMRPCGFHGYAPCPALGRPRSTASRARSSLAAAAAERPSLTASVRLGDDLRRRVPSRFGPRSCGSRAVAPAPLVQRFAYRRAAALLQPWFVCRFHGDAWTCPLKPPSPMSLPLPLPLPPPPSRLSCLPLAPSPPQPPLDTPVPA